MLRQLVLVLSFGVAHADAFVGVPAAPSLGRARAPLPSPHVASKPLAARHHEAAAALAATSGGAAAAAPEESTMGVSTFNLVKSIVGAGVLALPAGVGAFSSTSAALLPALLLTGTMGSLAAYCFILIGRLCEMTGTSTYRDAVAASAGKNTGNVLAVVSMCKTLVACLMYSIIIGDMTHALTHTALPAATISSLPAFATARVPLLWTITAAIITPLCLLRSFAALKLTSVLGIAGTIYTAIFMTIRKLDGSYAAGGKFHAQIAKNLQPAFNTGGNPLAIFVLLSMFSTAFVAHYNAPKFYSELKDKSVKRFTTLTGLSFGISAAIFATIMIAGFLTFGGAAQGLVLNNYASADKLATVARSATLLTILCGYPFTFVPARDSLLELSGINASQKFKDMLSLVMIACVTSIACVLRNLGFVSSLSGAVLGSMVIYIFPAIAFVSAVTGGKVANPNGSLNGEVKVARGVAATGVLLGIVGATVSILKQFTSVFA